MKEREWFTLLRIIGKHGGSVVVELNDSYAPGIPDVKGQLLVHNDFVSSVHDTFVEPRDLADRRRAAAGRRAPALHPLVEPTPLYARSPAWPESSRQNSWSVSPGDHRGQ
ncbi:DUF5959 family protein [Streptomyces sp. NPDC047869]|uniref:DUF5959 family protein n=1 Tax=Streptomyces sp. NPDC047869 TaxID=3154709 RepID=UPI003453B959